MTSTFTDYDASTLPGPALAYLDAQDARAQDEALATFAPDAVVHDDGSTYTGLAEIRDWLERASSEFTYTATRIAQQTSDPEHPVVQIRLDGNFPGGTVLLHYRFEITDGKIAGLSIGV